ncbi:MAG TPA: hypothetical protein VLB44_14990, partial [Kofleriaceae bacterium]|nr:hypothetical protein [Kofleriaceae bacterium]
TTMTRGVLVLLVPLAAACGDGKTSPRPDARAIPDAAPILDTPGQPYRHVIAIDGNDDFASGDTFPTTSASFLARVSWDDVNLYVGYSGPDLAVTTGDANKKWLFAYLDTTAGGETQSELYNTQRATFPAGFAADYYLRYKVDGTFSTLEHATGSGTWTTASPAPVTAQTGMFVEMSIPLSAIGAGTQLDLVSYMINEKNLAEGTYAGLYTTNFTDGYSANMQLTAYLHADFTSSRAPNDDANRRP